MKVYIYDEFLERTDKLCEAKRGNAELLRKLWIEHYNSLASSRCTYAEYAGDGDDGNSLFIHICDRFPTPVGQ